MPKMDTWQLRARMMELGSNLFHDTQLEDYGSAKAVEDIARDAAELAALAKVWLIRVHDKSLVPYNDPFLGNLSDDGSLSPDLNRFDDWVKAANKRRLR